MDLSPSRLANVEFRSEMRGYARDDVDRFLEDVAAGVAAMQEKIDLLSRRVARAEEDAGEARELEDTMRRTLLLAQRTADTAIKEAEARATRTLAEAADRADKVNSLADEKARSIVEEARARAEDEYRDTRRQLEAEVQQLTATRDSLTADIARLADHIEAQREILRTTLRRLLDYVADERFLAVQRPEGADVDPPTPGDTSPEAAGEVSSDPPADGGEATSGADESDDRDGSDSNAASTDAVDDDDIEVPPLPLASAGRERDPR